VSGPARKIAFLSPCFWPEVTRGAERIVRELADELIERGHHPRLITSHPGRLTRTVEDGLPILRLPRPPAGRLARRRFEDYPTHAPLSYLALRAGDDDLAQGVHTYDAIAAARWGERTGRPSVFAYMGIPDHSGLMARRRRLEATLAAARRCSATVALSGATRDAFKRWLGVDAHVIPPPIDVDKFTPALASRADRPTIVCAAESTEPRKRVRLLVDAFARVRRERPGARLILDERAPAGEGIERRDLHADGALLAAYREAWVSALPSRGEAFGMVLAEAMACGTPVVATNDGGMREVVADDRTGRLFDGDDPATLARALLEGFELASDPSTAAACRSRAEHFSAERCGTAYLELYASLA
jgi:glycosyltransferase involved in cell wall biosynthesis